jgi:hypothetical protein
LADALAAYGSISPAALYLIRVGYAVLLLLTLGAAATQARRFFTTETHDGYLDAAPWRDLFLHPAGTPILLGLWLACGVALLCDVYTVPATLVNLGLCYYFFVHTRWSGILRGMGAPGFMTFWAGALVACLEVARHFDPSQVVLHATVATFRIDFAVIFFCSGLYKATAGYRKGDGMELGMVNPWWGYWWPWVRKTSPTNPIYKLFNTLAYSVQMIAAVLMLIPATREIGALMIAVSFAGIATKIRLGFLCETVVLGTVLFLGAGSWLEQLTRAATWIPAAAPLASPPATSIPMGILASLLIGYALLLPFTKGGLYANFYFDKRLWGPLQSLLERYANAVGLIIWRVFTVDVVIFFTEIEVFDPKTGETKTYARPGRLDWASRLRYLHVGEFVCLASLFTTLKYHPSQRWLFDKKLIRYARTIHRPPGWHVRFTYMLIDKHPDHFSHRPVHQFEVDPDAGTHREITLDESANIAIGHENSLVREGVRPGSYAPVEG